MIDVGEHLDSPLGQQRFQSLDRLRRAVRAGQGHQIGISGIIRLHGPLLFSTGRAANRTVSPSAIVGCVRMASRNTVKGNPPSIAVCTTAMISPASTPNAVK